MRKAICWVMLPVVVLASNCTRKQNNVTTEDAVSDSVAVEDRDAAQPRVEVEDSIVKTSWFDAEMADGIAQTLPNTAVKRDEKGYFELFTNLDVAASDDHPNQWSLWLKDKRTGKVVFLVQTNNDAEPQWDQMNDRNAVEVPLSEIAAGECDVVFLVPDAPGKVFLEGCPDGRNVWSYIYDFYWQSIIQLPSNEGFVECDPSHELITLSQYRYHPEGGRYSVNMTFTYSGRYIGEETVEE